MLGFYLHEMKLFGCIKSILLYTFGYRGNVSFSVNYGDPYYNYGKKHFNVVVVKT